MLGHNLPALLCSLLINGECSVTIKKQICEWLRDSVNTKVNFYNYDRMWDNESMGSAVLDILGNCSCVTLPPTSI